MAIYGCLSCVIFRVFQCRFFRHLRQINGWSEFLLHGLNHVGVQQSSRYAPYSTDSLDRPAELYLTHKLCVTTRIGLQIPQTSTTPCL